MPSSNRRHHKHPDCMLAAWQRRAETEDAVHQWAKPGSDVCAGEPGQLEARLRQLDQALDAGRFHLKQREAAANGSDVDSSYMGYVSVTFEGDHLNINQNKVNSVWLHSKSTLCPARCV